MQTNVYLNQRNANRGVASLTLELRYEGQSNDKGRDIKSVSTTLYIAEKNMKDVHEIAAFYVNNASKSIIWSNIGSNPLGKAHEYIKSYLDRNAQRMLGMEVGALKKKPHEKKDEDKADEAE